MRIPLIVLLLQGFPEGIAFYTLAFVLANINLDWKKIVGGGILAASVVYFIRLFPINFGIHLAVMITFLFFYLIKIGKAVVITSIVTSLICLLILCLAETAFMYLFELFGLSSQTYITNNFMMIITGLPHVLFVFFVAFIIYYFRKRKVLNYDKFVK